MQSRLKRTYFRLLVPALAGFVVVFINREFSLVNLGGGKAGEVLVVAVFIASLVFAIAAPIFLRTLFAHQQREKKGVAEREFVQFEQNLIRIAMVTPYLSLVAYLLSFPEFYLAGSFLAGLYAVYYFYPSQRRIAFEKRIFRVE